MPTPTPNIGIQKPLGNETVSRSALNANYDIIDGAFVQTVNQDLANPADTGLLWNLISWIAGRLKAITGAADWKTAPATTLSAAKGHMDAAAPHTGHATTAALSAHQTAATLDHPDGSVVDAKLGNRTIDPAQAPSGNTGTLTQMLSWLANRIKAITGGTNWYDVPAYTLAKIKAILDGTDAVKVPAAALAGDVVTAINNATNHVGASAQVHGLPANVNVLGNRNAAGEFVQRGQVTSSAAQTGATSFYLSSESTTVTFPVAFSSTPRVFVCCVSDQRNAAGAQNVTTTAFAVGCIGDGPANKTVDWLAIGG